MKNVAKISYDYILLFLARHSLKILGPKFG